jgi:hypothetical protein
MDNDNEDQLKINQDDAPLDNDDPAANQDVPHNNHDIDPDSDALIAKLVAEECDSEEDDIPVKKAKKDRAKDLDSDEEDLPVKKGRKDRAKDLDSEEDEPIVKKANKSLDSDDEDEPIVKKAYKSLDSNSDDEQPKKKAPAKKVCKSSDSDDEPKKKAPAKKVCKSSDSDDEPSKKAPTKKKPGSKKAPAKKTSKSDTKKIVKKKVKAVPQPNICLVETQEFTMPNHSFYIPFYRTAGNQTPLKNLECCYILSTSPCYLVGKLGKISGKKEEENNAIELTDHYLTFIVDGLNSFSNWSYRPDEAMIFETLDQVYEAREKLSNSWCSIVDISKNGNNCNLDIIYCSSDLPKRSESSVIDTHTTTNTVLHRRYLHHLEATTRFYENIRGGMDVFKNSMIRYKFSPRLLLYFFYGYFSLEADKMSKYMLHHDRIATMITKENIEKSSAEYWSYFDYSDITYVNRCITWFRTMEYILPMETILSKCNSVSHLINIFQPESLSTHTSHVSTRLEQSDLDTVLQNWPIDDFLKCLPVFVTVFMRDGDHQPKIDTFNEASQYFTSDFWRAILKRLDQSNTELRELVSKALEQY